MGAVYDHYRARLEKAEGLEGQSDYMALDQGEYGTKLRHEAVLNVMRGNLPQARVLDLGCGTGLIWEAYRELEIKSPNCIHGVDMMTEREPDFMERMAALKVPKATFEVKDEETSFWDMKFGSFDVALAVGLVGYEGLNTVDEVEDLTYVCMTVGTNGAISVPMQTQDAQPLDYLTRFTVDEVKEAVPAWVKVLPLEREFVLFW